MEKTVKTEARLIQYHKRILEDYNRYKDLKGRYNAGKQEGDIFTLYRISDNHIICRFNVKTFLPA